uniref:Uncharacterized protein LOC114344785 isoform X2 n=1 Tax=Diabrotica virgifera virgifera TaxID=50390 RepID=A0A6P7H655_DIAVI
MTAATAAHMPETIKLQLRKPKSWHWELSTSKSSPNIILPVIQLYDYKGQLLVEAQDQGNTVRNVWGSNLGLNEDGRNGSSKRSRRLLRSRSDTSNFLVSPNTKTSTVSINPQERKRPTQRGDNSEKVGTSKEGGKDQRSYAVIRENGRGFWEHRRDKGVLVDEGVRTNPLEKSMSELLGEKRGHLSLSKGVERSKTAAEIRERRRHRRSKSDDLFRRKLRYNSSEESIKRAEMDGYRNFITANIPDDESQIRTGERDGDTATGRSKKPSRNRNRVMQTAETVSLDTGARNMELEEFLHNKRYTTRTSSAGTLIIPEESFKEIGDDVQKRRRGRRRDANTISSLLEAVAENKDKRRLETVPLSTTLSYPTLVNKNDGEISVDPGPRIFQTTGNKRHSRQTSDPTTLQTKCATFNRSPAFKGAQSTEKKSLITSNTTPTGLFYLRSEIFPFHGLLDHEIDKNNNFVLSKNNNNNSAIKNNPIAVVASSPNREIARQNCQNVASPPSVKQNNKKCRERTKVPKRRSRTIERASSSSSEEDRGVRKGHLIREHSAQREKTSGGPSTAVAETSADANDLLKLVRRLSYSYIGQRKAPNDGENAYQEVDDDVKMGANVSRHSAKGLGRRSQSSGSICNGGGGAGSGGKGRHPEGKICSSLPSYLDDRDKNGACNNNHDGKHHLDEVDRIPPIGDSAPLHWKFSDTQTICDQGYGSERSPEEEYPPNLTSLEQDSLQCHHHLEPHACYPFITPESTFLVKLSKGSRGLGLSVTGGVDSTGSWPGLIRIKRLFPHQPASSCGLLTVGDLLLEANGITLTGLTNYEALEVLRTAPNHVDLKICRPPPDVLNCVSPISEVPPPPPRREPPNNLNLPSNAYSTPEDDYYHGEFEITLKKIQGSLGFTLRKEDDSALGHYVRALVREPALTDGRIRAGDKIIAVNDVEICPMSHEQAVQFLRQCPEIVKLRLYRDSAQTPVATLSPTETTPRTSFSRKAHLRQEAVDMLNDLAGRKLCMNPEIYNRSMSPTSSPRRLRRQPFPSDASQRDYLPEGDYIPQQGDYIVSQGGPMGEYEIYHEQFHEGIIQKFPRPFDEDAFNSLFSMESEDGDRPNRPSSLELYNPNQTPVACRKPRFNFSLAHNAYELNNLDAEVLDAPNLKYNLCNEDVKTSDSEVHEPVSMPHIPIATTSNFSYKHPAYQSAHPQINSEPMAEPPQSVRPTTKTDDGTLRRRKNAAPEEKEVKLVQPVRMKEEYEILAIELNRGWNSRLGFSLQGAAGVTYVSAVHADSVAARDGRLKPGDRLIRVNDESIEHMTTSEIIDLLRIVRGPVCIVVSRVKSNEDCPRSNAEN